MHVLAELQPKGPYSLRLSGRLASDATRVVTDGTYRATIRVDDRLERVHAVQRADGAVVVAAGSDAGVDHVRFVLGLDDDHTEFLLRFERDPLLGETLRRVRGLRPMRTATVAQALLRAVAGQLIQAREARRIERRIIERTSPQLGGLHAAPTTAELARWSPAQLARFGLGARPGAREARLRALGTLGRTGGDGRAPRPVRRVGRARERVPPRGVRARSRTLPSCRRSLSSTSSRTRPPSSATCSPSRRRRAGRSC